jgi:Ca2+-binding RTX toxin-like protein
VLTTSAPSITEGDAGTKALTFTLTLSEAPTMDVVVNYQTLTSGTASSGDDFVAAAGTVTFAVGQRTAAVSVNVLGDTAVEANETVQVEFSGSRLVSSVTATGTITNDDTANAPVGAVSDSNTATNTVAENAVVGTVVGITASATDATAGETVAYALTTNPGNLFAIDAATGVVTVAGDLDFETAASHSITVAAISSDGSTSNASFTIAVTDVVEPRSFVLTTGQDTGEAFTGGAGSDVFYATTATLGAGDSLTGGAGTDTLSLTATGNATSVAGFTLNGIENVDVSIADSAAGTPEQNMLNMANAGAVRANLSGLTASGANGDSLVLNNLAAGASLAMTASTNLDLTASFVAAATGGTADAVSVALNGVSATVDADSVLTVADGIETMNIATSGAASTLGDVVFNGTRITVTGDQNLTVRQALDGTLQAIDASAFTGRLNIVTATDSTTPNATVSGVDVADISITGGSGNDTLNLTANASDDELSVNAGAGDDTVTIGNVLTNAASATAGDVLNGGTGNDTLAGDVDLFDAGSALLTGTTTLTGVSGFEVLSVNGFGGAEANTLNVSNVSADITTVAIASAVGGATTVNFGTAGAYTVNVGASAAIANETLTVDAGGSGTADSVTIANTNAATGTNQMGSAATAIVSTDFETVTINTGSYSTATAQLVNTVNVGTGTLALTGSNGLTTTATTGIITAGVINASAMTGALTMGAAAASVTSITGTSAADTLVGDASSTINGNAGNDTITGGAENDVLNGDAGNDTITTGAGTDNVNGGEGNDTIVLAGDASDSDSIDGGAGTDTLSVTNASIVALGAMGITEANRFNTNLSNVERIVISDDLDATGDSFDFGRLDGIQHITLNDIGGNQTIVGIQSGATLVHADTFSATADALTVTVTSADTSSSDSLNVDLTLSNTADYGVLNIANVETLNINATEATASTNVRAYTMGLNLTQATGGAAQSVIFTGTEALTIDTAIAARTIDASGMTVAAATDAGLTMSTGLTATTAIAGQTITGSGRADVLVGSTGSDNINGGGGNDAIHGGPGADTIDGGAGTDTYHTTGLVGVELEGAGTGTSTGVVVNLGATALTNANVLATTTQNLSGALTSVASGQVAYLFHASLPTNSSVVKTLSNIESVTLSGNGINYVVGSDAANAVVGGTGVDHINAGAGNDTIDGGVGADNLVAGTGDDVFLIALAADHAAGETMTGGAGNDTIRFTSTSGGTLDLLVGVTDTDNVINVVIGSAAGVTTGTTAENVNANGLGDTLAVNLTGNDGANSLTGNAIADTISGGAGADVITGGGGADSLDGGAGDDTFVYATVADFAAANAIVDSITGGAGTDIIRLGTALVTDNLTIASTVDFARASSVETIAVATAATTGVISITLGASAFTAGIRTVTLTGDTDATGNNVIDASAAVAGQELALTGSAGVDAITGGAGADTINGGAGADVIIGGAAADSINGGVGADAITGGTGRDSLTGGLDADTFVFAAGVTDTVATATSIAGVDIITDFTANGAAADLIDLTVVVAAVNTAVMGSLAEATFVANMNTLLNVGTGAGFNTTAVAGISAAVVTATAGDLLGRSFLAVDLDGSDTFTATDFVVEITGATLTSLTTLTFV